MLTCASDIQKRKSSYLVQTRAIAALSFITGVIAFLGDVQANHISCPAGEEINCETNVLQSLMVCGADTSGMNWSGHGPIPAPDFVVPHQATKATMTMPVGGSLMCDYGHFHLAAIPAAGLHCVADNVNIGFNCN